MNEISMNHQISSQLLQQSGKIKKISSALCKSHPEIVQEIDKILYAAIRIEKAAKKVQKACNCATVLKTIENQVKFDDDDTIFNEAQRSMKNLNSALHKLSRKVNIVINEAHFHPIKRQETQTHQKFKNPNRHNRPEKYKIGHHILQNHENLKTQKIALKTEQNYRQGYQFQEIQEDNEENTSKSLNALDQQIIQLVNQLRENGVERQDIQKQQQAAEELIEEFRRVQGERRF